MLIWGTEASVALAPKSRVRLCGGASISASAATSASLGYSDGYIAGFGCGYCIGGGCLWNMSEGRSH